MHDIQPYILVPNLIEQPTWGGEFITEHKGVESDWLAGKKIGQSFELFRDSSLSSKLSSDRSPSIQLADPSDPAHPDLHSHQDEVFPLQALIDQDPDSVLGKEMVKTVGFSMEILIKLNQAKGNSYQVHVKEATENDRWLPKPESWYYLQPGLVTLGAKQGIDWDEYKKICELVEAKAKEISKSVIDGKIDIKTGRTELAEFIKKHNPADFVNLVQVGKYQGVDLSACGIHHSWEQNDQTHPQGNIVYEVQKNVYDPQCTIRSFDKGKIKDNGSIREIQIEDYFEHIDRSEEANVPENHFTSGKVLKKTSTYTVKHIFDSADYKLQSVSLNKPVSNTFTTTDSFHHLFVESGNLKLMWQDKTWTVTQGFSIFIPASTGQYTIKPYRQKHLRLLKTYF